MIIDHLSNLEKYSPLVGNLDEIIQFIKKSKDYSLGKYELEQGFALVQEGYTIPREEALFESHEKYVDIQLLVSGNEVLEWANVNDLEATTTYDSEKDLIRYTGLGQCIDITPNLFYILYPHDAHKPCIYTNYSTNYRKIVFKIKIK